LRHIPEEKIFQDGIKLYFEVFANGNALSKEFETIMGKVIQYGYLLIWRFTIIMAIMKR
jgi:aminopeptidase N